MLELLQQGFGAVFSLNIMLLMLGGVAVGIVFGAVPGLSATMAVALCLPLTFTMGPQAGLSLLVALFIGATSGGLISAILLKIPGTPSSIATVFDGGPLMEQGLGVKALGVGIVFSFLGTIFSIIALMFIAPQLAKVALSFGPHEYFAIAVFSLTLIATLSAGSMVKGLFAGTLGIAVSTVGIAPVEAVRRFTFGVSELNGGFSMLTVMIGMFAVAEVIKLAETGRHAVRNKAGSVSMKQIKGFGFSLKEFRQELPNATRSGLIGLAVGILPGIGAGTSNLLSYIVAKKRAKQPETYGKGNIGGVVASETANNAGIGGAMMPLMTLGIPGDTTTRQGRHAGGALHHRLHPRADGGDQPAPRLDALRRQLRLVLHQPHRRDLSRAGPGLRALAAVQRRAATGRRARSGATHLNLRPSAPQQRGCRYGLVPNVSLASVQPATCSLRLSPSPGRVGTCMQPSRISSRSLNSGSSHSKCSTQVACS